MVGSEGGYDDCSQAERDRLQVNVLSGVAEIHVHIIAPRILEGFARALVDRRENEHDGCVPDEVLSKRGRGELAPDIALPSNLNNSAHVIQAADNCRMHTLAFNEIAH